MKRRIAITIDPKVLRMIDMRRAQLCMKRSAYINYKLRKTMVD